MSKNDKNYNNPFAAVLKGAKDGLFRKKSDKILNENERLDGKTCLVTGSNSGLGFAVAVELAKRGGSIIMAIRSGIEEAVAGVKKESGSEDVVAEKLELANPQSILDLVNRLKAKGTRIDILVCNAGVVSPGARSTDNGLDLMFAVNFFAKFVFVNALLKNKIIQPNHEIQPRLIFVSSESHRVSTSVDVDNFGKYKPYPMSKSVKHYGYSKKLLNTFITEFTRYWQKQGKELHTYTLCPGAIRSNIARSAPTVFKPLLAVMFRLFFKSPKRAAEPVVYLACSQGEDVINASNLYYHMMEETQMLEGCYDEKEGKRLWEASEQLFIELGYDLKDLGL